MQWKEELDRQIHSFQSTATSLATIDRRVTGHAHQIISLASKVSTNETKQRHLMQSIEYLRQQQGDMEAVLDKLEAELPSMAQSLGADHLQGPDDVALEAVEDLQGMSASLGEGVSTIVSRTNALAKAHSGPLPDLITILNSHLDTIQWLDANLNKLTTEARDVGRLGERVQLEMARREL
jgi:nuclear pore complex protein Nup62